MLGARELGAWGGEGDKLGGGEEGGELGLRRVGAGGGFEGARGDIMTAGDGAANGTTGGGGGGTVGERAGCESTG
jgi:hypothetical protein